MKIRRIVLFNFKSFTDEISMENVSQGANILIGKNGAGKSSILGAIKFVIDAHQRIGPVERRVFVNENSKELKAYVEIEFENADKAFPAGDTVVIRRTITQKSDEYTVNERAVSREEMSSLYETAGISKSMPYFVVEQGKIGELAQMNGNARMELIRELAGSAVYEKDKEEIQRVLQESESIEQRIADLVKTIEKRVAAIEQERQRSERKKEVEESKEILVRELYKRELHKIRVKLEDLFTEEMSQIESTQDITEDALRIHLEEILSAMHALPADTADLDLETVPERIQEISEKIDSMGEALKEKEKKRSVLKREIKSLERLESSSKAIRPEINILRMRGEDAVKKKLDGLKRMKTEEGFAQSSKNREDLLESKRAIWKKEKEHSKRRKSLEAEMKDAERVFLSTQKVFSLGDEIRSLKGVVGYVYDIITMPKEILAAVSSALPNFLVTIVTETAEDAINLVRAHRIEQPVISIPQKSSLVRHSPVPLTSLAQYISSSEKHASLVDRLFGRIYFVSDFETAKTVSRQHRVAVITAAGEYFGSVGTVTGGEDKSSYLFRSYVAAKEKYRESIEEEKIIQEEKKRVELEYEKASTETALSAPGYIEDAIFLLENEGFDADMEILHKKTELEKISLNAMENEMEKCVRLRETFRNAIARKDLEAQAQAIEQKLQKCAGSPQWREKISEKVRLESKFRRIQKRILSLDVESREEIVVNDTKISLQDAPKETLVQALSLLKKELLEAISPSETSEQILDDYNKTVKKLNELSAAKKKILEMQSQLELKKEQVISITISQVKSNFEYFFRKLTKGTAQMTVANTSALEIDVSFAGEKMVRSDELSGGQKTVIALCMILSVQKIYEAPFYLMDEFDANLDTQVLMSIIESRVFDKRQLFFCTFRGETLGLGEQFFCIKDSKVFETSLASAQEDLCSFLP
ncbi:structural maintenance of chromosome 3 (chondroitin sulfate proteoglycan 6) [Nematocida minor]|uniref:structural maintenance of chromosome 3 (chondroitin sulfate proteoglycan 6) n=1 Tax=Nematocida minor TaxID=1912983 RepID=UPI002220AD85|nr:structural maintenance of chromosome 3 (chondroitin sulfate proteoglycan 6) [Nematocida minor]KAI5189486.1 structural maintenance of chromosome 3 (chondroitin sulfate proteoglycan 6) [Nematocida minor]